MINWESNVFPGILGRTCDRPCEPACRRGRVEEEPVAICRLKRVAADNKGDITAPAAASRPRRRNGKRVALIGAGPGLADGGARPGAARLRDRAVRRARRKAGGMIRSQIPRFRLPEAVIDEEVGYILGLGDRDPLRPARRQPEGAARPKATTRCSSAPARRAAATSRFPAAQRARANIHIGIDWLASVSFGHIEQDRQARDRAGRRQHRDGLLPHRRGASAARTSRSIVRSRLRGDEGVALGEGGRDARGHPDPQLSRAEANSRTTNGKLTGVLFEKVGPEHDEKGRRRLVPTGEPDVHYRMRRRAGGGRPGERVPVDRARHRHRLRQVGHAGGRQDHHPVDASRKCSSAATRRSGRRTSSGRSPTAMRRRSRSTCCAKARTCNDRPPPIVKLVSQKMGIHEWSYDNEIDNRPALQRAAAKDEDRSLKRHSDGGRTRLRPASSATRRPSAASIATSRRSLTRTLCIECDACVDICPMDCITFTANGDEADLRDAAEGAGAQSHAGPLCLRRA